MSEPMTERELAEIERNASTGITSGRFGAGVERTRVEGCPRPAQVPYITPEIMLATGRRLVLCAPHSQVGALQVSSDGRVTVVGEKKA